MGSREELVATWLADYKRNHASGEALDTYAVGLSCNSELVAALFCVVEETKYHDKFLRDICETLFDLYRKSKEKRLKLFALSFLPSLIGLHLTKYNAPANERKAYQCVEVLLLGIYNLEVVDEEGNPVKKTFRFPNLSKPSVYHEPSLSSSQQTAPTTALTEHALHKLETSGGSGDLLVSVFGPYSDQDQIIAANRWTIMTVLLKVYNDNLSSLQKLSLYALCRTCIRILSHGRQNTNRIVPKNSGTNSGSLINYAELISRSAGNHCRINPTSAFLVEMLNSVYYCLFNDVSNEAMQALHKIHSRATICLFTDVLIMVHAIRNCLRLGTTAKDDDDSPMGLSMALSPTSNTSSSAPGISKTAITNASFKTRKLPDDIPIVAQPAGGATPGATTTSTALTSINEEAEGDGANAADSGGKNTKNTSKSSTPTGKMTVLREMLKERKEKKKDSSGKKDKKAREKRDENGGSDSSLLNNKHVVIEDHVEVHEIGSDIETKSFGSDHETVPLTTFKGPRGGAFERDDSSNCSSNLGSADAVNVPLVGASDSSHPAKAIGEANVNV